jgi:hypothetical protein
MHAAGPAHILNLIILIIAQFQSSSYAVFSVLLLLPSEVQRVFSNTLSPCSSLNARAQVLYPYKTTGKIEVLYILICTIQCHLVLRSRIVELDLHTHIMA